MTDFGNLPSIEGTTRKPVLAHDLEMMDLVKSEHGETRQREPIEEVVMVDEILVEAAMRGETCENRVLSGRVVQQLSGVKGHCGYLTTIDLNHAGQRM